MDNTQELPRSEGAAKEKAIYNVGEIAPALNHLGRIFYEKHAGPAGFRDEPRTLERELMLFISEAVEMFEDIRGGKTQSDHIPSFTPEEEEAADIIIRVLECAHYRKWRIGEAVTAKFAYNLTRPYKHGKKF